MESLWCRRWCRNSLVIRTKTIPSFMSANCALGFRLRQSFWGTVGDRYFHHIFKTGAFAIACRWKFSMAKWADAISLSCPDTLFQNNLWTACCSRPILVRMAAFQTITERNSIEFVNREMMSPFAKAKRASEWSAKGAKFRWNEQLNTNLSSKVTAENPTCPCLRRSQT